MSELLKNVISIDGKDYDLDEMSSIEKYNCSGTRIANI